jgi:hypothetical protein
MVYMRIFRARKSGVLTIALSVPAIVNNFTLYYTHAQSRQKLRERKRKFNRHKWKRFIDKSKPGGLFKAIKGIFSLISCLAHVSVGIYHAISTTVVPFSSTIESSSMVVIGKTVFT